MALCLLLHFVHWLDVSRRGFARLPRRSPHTPLTASEPGPLLKRENMSDCTAEEFFLCTSFDHIQLAIRVTFQSTKVESSKVPNAPHSFVRLVERLLLGGVVAVVLPMESFQANSEKGRSKCRNVLAFVKAFAMLSQRPSRPSKRQRKKLP